MFGIPGPSQILTLITAALFLFGYTVQPASTQNGENPAEFASNDVLIAALVGGLVFDDEPIIFDKSQTQNDSVNSVYGPAQQLVRTSENALVIHRLEILMPKNFPDTLIATHSLSFKASVWLDQITGFRLALPRDSQMRLAYGPAANTAYMDEDYIDIPAVPGYAKSGNMLYGGVPFNDVWTAEGGVFVGVLAAEPGSYELPISVEENQIELAFLYGPDDEIGAQAEFEAGDSLSLPPVMVGRHTGDFFAPLRRYTQALELHSGKQYIDVAPARQTARDPYWKTWGLDKKLNGEFTADQVLEIADVLAETGIRRVMLDYGWFVTEGLWEATDDVGFDGDDDLIKLIDDLRARDFELGLWYQPLQIDPDDEDVQADLLQYAVLDEDGDLFIDDDDLALLDPVRPEVQAYSRDNLARFAEMGVRHIYLDSQEAQLATPPDYALARPLDSHEALPKIYDLIREQAARHGIIAEICPDGRSHTLLNMPQSVTNIGDPKNDRQLRAEFRWLRAIQGSEAVIGTYVEPFPDNGVSGSFLNIAGIGGNLQSIGDFDSLRDPDWPLWLEFEREHRLQGADYLPLYDIGFDQPETHALVRDDRHYFGLFTKTEGADACFAEDCADADLRQIEAAQDAEFAGNFELRGLAPGIRYQVTDFPPSGFQKILTADDVGTALLPVSFSKEMLLIATPAPGG